jgi:hypothetical protein
MNKVGVVGNVACIAGIALMLVFVGYRRVDNAIGLLVLLQLVYLIGFGLDPENLEVLDFLSGFSYSVMGFIPSPFNYPPDLVAPSSQSIIKYAIDGSLIRNAGCSLILLSFFALVMGTWKLITHLKDRQSE